MTPRHARLGVDVFTGLVVASVALALASLSWRLMGYASDAPVVSPLPPGLSGAGNIAPLIALSPFGTASEMAVEGSDSALTLRAIFAAIPASESVALIAGPDGQVIPVSIGDATPGGIVEAIEPEKVTLRTSTGLRILGFDPAAGGSVASSGFAPVVPTMDPGTGNAAGASATRPTPLRGVDAIRSLIPQSDVPTGQATAAPPPAPPPPASGTPPLSTAPAAGYRVGSQLPEQLQAAGIRPGDVIRAVNGSPVSGNESQQALLGRAMVGISARIELVRDGKRVSLTVPMR
ncbi:type II secretion system protein N [Erythrobacter sp. QSSC1-22B]|uniref:type II secretion system protein N n=1 Tax=Erythrobacter sp. QSSC1-22B TaxID=1860125 RepID=UPI0011A6F87A|nr:type II secretion system protein N [Erythrobacter sp. QSSC1-22B]